MSETKGCSPVEPPLSVKAGHFTRRCTRVAKSSLLTLVSKTARLVGLESSRNDFADAPATWAYTTGPKRFLGIIARFQGETAWPVTEATFLTRMKVVASHYDKSSYGKLSLTPTIALPVTLPHPATSYNSGTFAALLTDAKAAAKVLGYDAADYDFFGVVTRDPANAFPYAGRGWVGAPGVHIDSGYVSLRTIGHEIGHNLGLYHSGYWDVNATYAAAKDGRLIEYGSLVCGMCGLSGSYYDSPDGPHFDPAHKFRIKWIEEGIELKVLSSASLADRGTSFRLHSYETLGGLKAFTLNLPWKDQSGRNWQYWGCYRTTYPNPQTKGLNLSIAGAPYNSLGSVFLDLTPNSQPGGGTSYNSDLADKLDGLLKEDGLFLDRDLDLEIRVTDQGTDEKGLYLDLWMGHVGMYPGTVVTPPPPPPPPPPIETPHVVKPSYWAGPENPSTNPARNEVIANLFDGSVDTKWLARLQSPTLTFTFASPITLTGLRLASANDYSSRYPKTIVVRSSLDAVAWTDVVALTVPPWSGHKLRSPVLPVAATGLHFQLTLTSSTTITQLSELEFIAATSSFTTEERLALAQEDADRLAIALETGMGAELALLSHTVAVKARS